MNSSAMLRETRLRQRPVPRVDAVIDTEHHAEAVLVCPIPNLDNRRIADRAILGRFLHPARCRVGSQNCSARCVSPSLGPTPSKS